MSWILASLGVYLRDVGQVVSVSIPVIMFLSPIFFPITALPLEYHFIFKINPLTFVIEQSRDVLLWNKGLSWLGWSKHMFGATLFAWLGYCWFQKTRKGFADVL
jgi:lipopolysaccharide transport system permease protein